MTQIKPTRPCPYCRETIYSNALLCRFCRRDLPPEGYSPQRCGRSWLPLALASAVFIGGAALLAAELQREMRCWQEELDFLDDE